MNLLFLRRASPGDAEFRTSADAVRNELRGESAAIAPSTGAATKLANSVLLTGLLIVVGGCIHIRGDMFTDQPFNEADDIKSEYLNPHGMTAMVAGPGAMMTPPLAILSRQIEGRHAQAKSTPSPNVSASTATGNKTVYTATSSPDVKLEVEALGGSFVTRNANGIQFLD